mmetsp:Transcript_3626/g.9242  ORF Transcript_3626/g.9242 Transcript_3626/m.9242 type:complete len:86 (-) Transcript_3626:240-497(-)
MVIRGDNGGSGRGRRTARVHGLGRVEVSCGRGWVEGEGISFLRHGWIYLVTIEARAWSLLERLKRLQARAVNVADCLLDSELCYG